MKLDTRAFAIATAVIIAVAYAICAFFVALAPEATRAFFGYLFHIDLTGLSRAITWESFFAGIIGSFVGTAIVAGAVSWLYNLLAQNREHES